MDYQERSQKEHYQLLDACQKQDTKAAVRLLKRHIDIAREQLIAYLQQIAHKRWFLLEIDDLLEQTKREI